MKPEDEGKPDEPVKPPRKPGSALASMTPEQRRDVEEFRKGLGESLVNNLNRNVVAEHGRDNNSEQKYQPPARTGRRGSA